MTAFADLASTGCPFEGRLALALAAELRAVDLEAADAVLGSIADGFAAARGLPPIEQLAHCAGDLAGRLTARVRPGAVDDLLLDHVLATGAGDPVCWAIACVEAARRAGIPLGIVADGDEHVLVAHRDIDAPLVVEPQAPARPLLASELPTVGDVTWRCGHESALIALDRLVVRAVRAGRLGDALRAASLRLELPLDDATRDRLRAERDAVARRLN